MHNIFITLLILLTTFPLYSMENTQKPKRRQRPINIERLTFLDDLVEAGDSNNNRQSFAQTMIQIYTTPPQVRTTPPLNCSPGPFNKRDAITYFSTKWLEVLKSEFDLFLGSMIESLVLASRTGQVVPLDEKNPAMENVYVLNEAWTNVVVGSYITGLAPFQNAPDMVKLSAILKIGEYLASCRFVYTPLKKPSVISKDGTYHLPRIMSCTDLSETTINHAFSKAKKYLNSSVSPDLYTDFINTIDLILSQEITGVVHMELEDFKKANNLFNILLNKARSFSGSNLKKNYQTLTSLHNVKDTDSEEKVFNEVIKELKQRIAQRKKIQEKA